MSEDSAAPILLVDDNDAHRTLIRRALKKAGIAHPLLEASSLGQARELLFEAPPKSDGVPAIAILDLHLGDGRGTTLVAELRASDRYRGIPILMVSTSALKSDIEESYRLGTDRYLTKSDDVNRFSADVANGVQELIKTS